MKAQPNGLGWGIIMILRAEGPRHWLSLRTKYDAGFQPACVIFINTQPVGPGYYDTGLWPVSEVPFSLVNGIISLNHLVSDKFEMLYKTSAPKLACKQAVPQGAHLACERPFAYVSTKRVDTRVPYTCVRPYRTDLFA